MSTTLCPRMSPGSLLSCSAASSSISRASQSNGWWHWHGDHLLLPVNRVASEQGSHGFMWHPPDVDAPPGSSESSSEPSSLSSLIHFANSWCHVLADVTCRLWSLIVFAFIISCSTFNPCSKLWTGFFALIIEFPEWPLSRWRHRVWRMVGYYVFQRLSTFFLSRILLHVVILSLY